MSTSLLVLGRAPTNGLKPAPVAVPSSMVMRHLVFGLGLLSLGTDPVEKCV
jgi:hypothetical protein